MDKKGFTLVELMVVIVIIGVLAAVAIPKMVSAVDKAKAAEAPQMLSGISNMEHAYYAEQGDYVYPATTADWEKLSMPSEPSDKNFKYSVAAGTPTTDGGFLLSAVSQIKLAGVASGAATLTLNAKDDRKINGLSGTAADADPIGKLIPHWR